VFDCQCSKCHWEWELRLDPEVRVRVSATDRLALAGQTDPEQALLVVRMQGMHPEVVRMHPEVVRMQGMQGVKQGVT
jgi:hypothetical protein